MPRVLVVHSAYGCDTGCCGHVVEVDDRQIDFQFAHPSGTDARRFAEELVREAGCDPADLDWENSIVVDDD
jgi:hypothetical protein